MAGHGHDNHGHGSDSDEIVLHQEKLGGVFVLSFLIAIVTLVVLGQAGNTKLTLLSGKEAYDSVQAQLPKLSSEHKKGDTEHKEEKKRWNEKSSYDCSSSDSRAWRTSTLIFCK